MDSTGSQAKQVLRMVERGAMPTLAQTAAEGMVAPVVAPMAVAGTEAAGLALGTVVTVGRVALRAMVAMAAAAETVAVMGETVGKGEPMVATAAMEARVDLEGETAEMVATAGATETEAMEVRGDRAVAAGVMVGMAVPWAGEVMEDLEETTTADSVGMEGMVAMGTDRATVVVTAALAATDPQEGATAETAGMETPPTPTGATAEVGATPMEVGMDPAAMAGTEGMERTAGTGETAATALVPATAGMEEAVAMATPEAAVELAVRAVRADPAGPKDRMGVQALQSASFR